MNVLGIALGFRLHTCEYAATVAPSSERAALWREVHGGLSVPIREPWPSLARVAGIGMALCYELATERLSGAEQARLCEALGERFGMSYAEARTEFLTHGVPILAEDVVVRSCCGEVVL